MSARLRVCLANANFIRNFCRLLVAHEAADHRNSGATVADISPPHNHSLSLQFPTVSVSSGSCIWDFPFTEWIIFVFCRQSNTNVLSAQVGKMRAKLVEGKAKRVIARKMSERKLMRCAEEKRRKFPIICGEKPEYRLKIFNKLGVIIKV